MDPEKENVGRGMKVAVIVDAGARLALYIRCSLVDICIMSVILRS